MIYRVVVSLVAIVFTAIYAMANMVVDQHKQDNPKVTVKEKDKNVIQLYQVKPLHTSDKQLDCLARNIFFEAGTENELGKYGRTGNYQQTLPWILG